MEGFAFFFGFWGGVLADTGNRWRLIRLGRLICFASFLGLAINAATLGAVWLTAVLVAANGLSGAVGITALLAVLPSLVDRSKMHAVGALNTLSLRLGAIVAPVIGGALVASVGAGWTYGLGAASVLLAIPGRRARPTGRPIAPVLAGRFAAGPLTSLREGYEFIVSDRVVLGVMIGGVVGMLGGGSFVLVPVLVNAKFGDQPVVVGLVYAALSVGLLGGAAASGRLSGVRRAGLLLLVMMIVSFGCYAAGASGSVVLVLVFVVAAGVSISVEEALRYALLQLRRPADGDPDLPRPACGAGRPGGAVEP